MESKQFTLRSQTTQCPHCGEYYSVTYKYCPFCDVGRKEEERRQAEKKQQRQAKLGSVLGGEPDKKKKKPAQRTRSEQAFDRERPEPRPRREAPADWSDKAEAPKAEPRKAEAPKAETRKAETPKAEPKKAPAPKKKESLFFRKETRKKTSEMTEEERKAHLADREARAAERKRLRDQAAREAGLLDSEPSLEAAPAQESLSDLLDAKTYPATPAMPDVEPPVGVPVSAEGPVIESGEPAAELADIPVFTPAGEAAPAQETPAVEAAPADEMETVVTDWTIAPDLNAAPVVEVEAPAAPAEVSAPVDAPAQAAPAAEPPQKAPVAGEEDLDALLSEIRDMLADSPVPKLAPDQLKKPEVAVTVDETVRVQGGAHLAAEDAAEMAAQPAEAPVEEAAAPAPVVEEPAAPVAEPVAQPVVEVEAPAPVVEEPTIVVPTAEVQAELASQTADTPVAVDQQPTQVLPEVLDAVQPAQPVETAVPAPIQEEEEEDAPKAEAPKKTKKKSKLPLILSLIVIIAAAVIVVTQVVPTFTDGLFSGGQQEQQEETVDGNAAQSVTLDQTDLSTSEKGMTVTLVATLAPEGSTGTVTWASSNPDVASVDQNGLVTALAPGETVITATLENGVAAQCNFRCTWTADTPQPSEDVLLSATSISLDGEGKTKQITVTGNEGEVKWTSSAPEVATVAADGTVTAVAKGAATVTAEVDGETLTCDVKCIW